MCRSVLPALLNKESLSPAIPVVRTSDLRFNAEREGQRAGEGGTPRPTIAPFSVARSLACSLVRPDRQPTRNESSNLAEREERGETRRYRRCHHQPWRRDHRRRRVVGRAEGHVAARGVGGCAAAAHRNPCVRNADWRTEYACMHACNNSPGLMARFGTSMPRGTNTSDPPSIDEWASGTSMKMASTERRKRKEAARINKSRHASLKGRTEGIQGQCNALQGQPCHHAMPPPPPIGRRPVASQRRRHRRHCCNRLPAI